MYRDKNRNQYPFRYNRIPDNGRRYNDRNNDIDRYNVNRENILPESEDYGPEPFVVNIEDVTLANDNFRTALWTGEYLQLTLMSVDVGGEIGLELHTDTDQFLRVEQGKGTVYMGDTEDRLDYQRRIYDNYAVFVPAGKWHNVVNTGRVPLKLYSLYAPPHHPHGTVHETAEDAEHDDH